MCYSGTAEEQRSSSSTASMPLKMKTSLSLKQTTTLSSIASYVGQGLIGFCMGLAVILFSLWLPFFLTPEAANAVYDPAPGFQYSAELSHFDNSPMTYLTDYALVVLLSLLSWHIYTLGGEKTTSALQKWTIGLLLGCYASSVLAGGVAHQFYTTLEMRNSWSFRLLWSICVGTVYFASACMGSAASEVAAKSSTTTNYLPTTGSFVWIVFGTTSTILYFYGLLGYQRPACDIFIAGITQFPPTAYTMLICWMSPQSFEYKILGPLAFIGNAALLPLYPCLVHYTDLSLGQINTLLHCWLCVCWSAQGWTLRHYMLNNTTSSSSTKKVE